MEERCGKCTNCENLERVKQKVLACANPPFSHADDGVVNVWNQELTRLHCLSPGTEGPTTRKELEAADRDNLVSYLEYWGFACYGHEPTEELREAALLNYETEGE